MTITTARAPSSSWDRGPHRSESPRFVLVSTHHGRQAGQPGPENPRVDQDVDFIPLDPPILNHSFVSLTTPARPTFFRTTCTNPRVPLSFVRVHAPKCFFVTESHVRIPWSDTLGNLDRLLRASLTRLWVQSAITCSVSYPRLRLPQPQEQRGPLVAAGWVQPPLLRWEFTRSCFK